METESFRKELELTAAKFAARHVAPIAADADHGDPAFPAEVFRQGREAGFDKLALPESAGGSGLGLAELCLIVEVLSRTCAGHAAALGVHAAAAKALCDAGCDEKRLSSGRPIAAAMPDPDPAAGFESDLAFRREGGGFLLLGKAGIAVNFDPSGRAIVFAKDSEGQPAAFLTDARADGLRAGAFEKTLGLRAMTMAEIAFDHGAVTKSDLIAEGKPALDFYRALFRSLCLVVAASASGVMSESCRRAYAYAAERYQGGKMLIDHSHLRNILGSMSAQVSAAAGSVRHAASLPEGDLAAFAAKAAATDGAVRVCTDAVQILGGYGYMRDYGLEKAMRDAATLSLFPASNPRIELLIAARGKASGEW